MSRKAPIQAALLILIFCSVFKLDVYSQHTTKGKDFWFGYMYNLISDAPLEAYVSSERLVSGTVTVVGTGFSQVFTVMPNTTTSLSIPNSVMATDLSDVVEAKAVHIETCDTVSVYAINKGAASDDATVVYPTPILGNDYMVLTKQGNPGDWGKEFLIVASVNNSVIEIIPSVATDGGHAAGVAYNITLNKGDQYQVTSGSDLTGTKVRGLSTNGSCANFAVFTGSKCLNIAGCVACDHIYEQIMPTKAWGKHFVVGKFAQKAALVYRVLANTNGTSFTIDGGLPLNLNSGQFYEYSNSGGVGPSYIASNNPVMVMQYMAGAKCDANELGDPDQVLISPIEQTMNLATFYTIPSSLVTVFYANVAAKTSAVSGITLNGVSISSSFIPVPSNPIYSYSSGVPLTQGTNYQLKSDSGFCAFVYGMGTYESYTYPVGTSMKDLTTDFEIVSPAQICTGNTWGFAAVMDTNALGYEWDYGDGSTDVGINTTHVFNAEGTYTVTMTKVLSGGCNPMVVKGVVVKNPVIKIYGTDTICLGQTAQLWTNLSSDSLEVKMPTECGDTIRYKIPNQIGSVTWSNGSTDTLITVNPTISTMYYLTSSVFGCAAKDSFMVHVSKPNAAFTANAVCKGVATSFSNQSVPIAPAQNAITSCQWDFTSDGVTDSITFAPSNVFSISGTYNTSLIVKDAHGCSDTVTNLVTVYGSAVSDFMASAVCFGTSTGFTDNSTTTTQSNTGAITDWDWSFGDLTNATIQNPTHLYATASNSNANTTYTVELVTTTTHGCKDTITKPVIVYALPTAAFVSDSVCLNSGSHLTSTAQGNGNAISNYEWDFTNDQIADISGTSTVTYTLGQAGNSMVNFTVTSTPQAGLSCKNFTSMSVYVNTLPIASFSATSVCAGSITNFTDLSTTSTGSINSWQWDFTNDGITDSNGALANYVYLSSGNHVAALTVGTDVGCLNTYTSIVNVFGHAVPNFAYTNACFNGVNTFSSTSTTTLNLNTSVINSYTYLFGDGNSFIGANASHTYTVVSNLLQNTAYTVSLIVSTMDGCADTINKPVTVYALPIASFLSDSVCLQTASHLLSTGQGNGNLITGHDWDFNNDGVVDVSGVNNPNYVFGSYGNNAVSYTVTSTPQVGLNCTQDVTQNVWVNPLPTAAFSFTNTCENTPPLNFDASASGIITGSNSGYIWQYGDGQTGNGVLSGHVYAQPATYDVTLTVISDKNCEGSVTHSVEVYAQSKVQVAVNTTCLGGVTSFTANALPGSGNVVNWLWDVDNTINTVELTGATNLFVYSTAGTQTLNLVTVTNYNCRDTITKLVYVNYVPSPQFSVDVPSGCTEHCVVLTDQTPNVPLPAQINQWDWDFGNGVIENVNSNIPQRVCYNNVSSNELVIYNVTLTVSTDSGCVATIVKPNYITVYPNPVAGYTIVPEYGDVVVPLVHFINESIDYTKWWWNFGDGTGIDSIYVDPNHYYPDGAVTNYTSELTVANEYGCKDKVYLLVEIKPGFSFYIPNAFTPNGDGLNDLFGGIGVGIKEYEMRVFDRWGEQIFYTDDITKGWDGNVYGKEGDKKQDVYTWKVKLKDDFDKAHFYVGHVTLLR